MLLRFRAMRAVGCVQAKQRCYRFHAQWLGGDGARCSVESACRILPLKAPARYAKGAAWSHNNFMSNATRLRQQVLVVQQRQQQRVMVRRSRRAYAQTCRAMALQACRK